MCSFLSTAEIDPVLASPCWCEMGTQVVSSLTHEYIIVVHVRQGVSGGDMYRCICDESVPMFLHYKAALSNVVVVVLDIVWCVDCGGLGIDVRREGFDR